MLKGTPHALPRDYEPATPTTPEKGYRGGVLDGIKVLGAFVGDDEWCSEQLCKRVRVALEPLKGIVQLEDSAELDTKQQAQQCLLRFCSNATLDYFLRTMPPSVTIDAARLHDGMIEEAFHRIVASAAGSPSQRARAIRHTRESLSLRVSKSLRQNLRHFCLSLY